MNNFFDDDQSQNLQEVIAKGLQAAGQIGQNAQAMSPLGGNRIAQRMAATQNQARQALDRQHDAVATATSRGRSPPKVVSSVAAQRLQASKLAEAIRAQAKAGGVDLAGYSPRQAKKFVGLSDQSRGISRQSVQLVWPRRARNYANTYPCAKTRSPI